MHVIELTCRNRHPRQPAGLYATAIMPVGCNSVSLIGTSVGVTSAGPGDLQAQKPDAV